MPPELLPLLEPELEPLLDPVSLPASMLPLLLPELLPLLEPELLPLLDPLLLPELLPVSVELSPAPLLLPLLPPLSLLASDVASSPASPPPPVVELLLPPHPVVFAATAQPVSALTMNHRFKESTVRMNEPSRSVGDQDIRVRIVRRHFRPGAQEHAAGHPDRAGVTRKCADPRRERSRCLHEPRTGVCPPGQHVPRCTRAARSHRVRPEPRTK
jgi:hypothetical protein